MYLGKVGKQGKMLEEEHQEAYEAPVKLAKGRGKETLFRVAARNQIELIAIADNKANIITGINVLLISIIIAFFGSGATLNGIEAVSKLELVIPLGILMLACLVSAIYAILSAKPQIIPEKEGDEKSITFFQNYYRDSMKDYIDHMYQVLSSPRKTYDQLIIDMFNNGIVLHRKYELLKLSYNIFMIGLILAVASFILIMIII